MLSAPSSTPCTAHSTQLASRSDWMAGAWPDTAASNSAEEEVEVEDAEEEGLGGAAPAEDAAEAMGSTGWLTLRMWLNRGPTALRPLFHRSACSRPPHSLSALRD